MSTAYKVVIPARYESVRFPGKSLADIHGKPMIQHVYEAATKSGAEEVIIATDSPRIGMAAEEFGATVMMTSSDHQSGTDRIGEVVDKTGWNEDTVIVNLQGDEPLMPAATINQVAQNLIQQPHASCATLYAEMDATDDDGVLREDPNDPNIVKVVLDNDSFALYFSRAAIPYYREQDHVAPTYYRHIGLYAYRAAIISSYSQLPESPLEHIEKLEQLRLLSNGKHIHVAQATEIPGPGVDTPEDLQQVLSLFEA